MENTNDLWRIRLEKLEMLRQADIEPYADRYIRTHKTADILERFEELEGQEVSIAGRIMSKRDQGKLSLHMFKTLMAVFRVISEWTNWVRLCLI